MRTATVLALFLLSSIARAGTPSPGYTDTLFAGGLNQPTAIAFMPDGRMLVTQKGGELHLIDGGTDTNLVTIPVCTDSEMGLLGIALDPAFGTNGFIYLYRTKPGPGGCGTNVGRFSQVVRVTFGPGDTVAIGSLVELLDGIRSDNGNHDGGVLRIGPDGTLYIGAGDTGLGDNVGGPGSSTNPYAQDLKSLNGKTLRINLDGSIPADNPFASAPGAVTCSSSGTGIATCKEIWAYGFRNPFRMSFDDMTGKLWIADVGDLTVEEVDIGVAGGNYSWPRCEGDLQGPPGSPQPCVVGTDVAPIFTYPHSGGSSLGGCIIGGSFTGAAFGAMAGNYFFGDCDSANLYLATVNGTRDDIVGTPITLSTNVGAQFGAIADAITGPDGAIYYASVSDGEIRRVAPVLAEQLVFGKNLLLKDKPTDPSKKSASATAKDVIVLGDDPTMNDGDVRIVSAGFDDTYPMPMTGWEAIGNPTLHKGWVYRDRDQVNGPITRAMIRNGKFVKISAKGAGLGHTLGTDPNPVGVDVRVGTTHYCMSFGGTTMFTADMRYHARNAPAPASCPP